MDRHDASAAPRPGEEPVASLKRHWRLLWLWIATRTFLRKLGRATLNGAAAGVYVVGAGFAAATVIGLLGNPIWRWGCWLWNLWT